MLGLWGGCVLAEFAMEGAAARQPAFRPAAAAFHDTIDRVVEIPILIAVVATGLKLASTAAWDGQLIAHVVCGLGAIGVNVACAFVVFKRVREARDGADEARLRELTRWVWAAASGVPLALVALYLGGHRFGWW